MRAMRIRWHSTDSTSAERFDMVKEDKNERIQRNNIQTAG
jgi:hypothetical protein